MKSQLHELFIQIGKMRFALRLTVVWVLVQYNRKKIKNSFADIKMQVDKLDIQIRKKIKHEG